jgi:hypothetical protein
MTRAAITAGLLLALLPAAGFAQQPPAPQPASEDLAKQLANPISSLVSMPFQFNWEQGVGPHDQTRFILNIQPVMPFSLNEKWNLISRLIVPFVGQPPLSEGGDPAFGVGDVSASFFFSPAHSKRLIWGVGPVFTLPSTAEPTIGSEKWSTGPTIVVLKQAGQWTIGALWNQVWSYSGNPERNDVNQMFLQPFLSYQATKTITLTVQSETTANWEVTDGRWTVPINVLVAKLSTFGTFPASYQFGVGAYPVHPDIGPSWKVRAAIVILLPKKQ